MSEVLQSLYDTIPFIQLFNNRFNILGLIWFASLTIITFKCLIDSDYSFGIKNKNLNYIGVLSVSIFTIWVFYRALDEILTIFTVLSWDPSLLTFTADSVIFWSGKILSYSIIMFSVLYLFRSLKIDKFFEKKGWITLYSIISVLLIQNWSVSVFKVDYAVLQGIERISVFWKFYPLLYISYSIFYYSLFRGKVNGS